MHFNNMKLVSYMVVVKRYIRNILGLYCGYQGAGGGRGERESSAIGEAFATKGLITSISYTKELQPYFGESWNSKLKEGFTIVHNGTLPDKLPVSTNVPIQWFS